MLLLHSFRTYFPRKANYSYWLDNVQCWGSEDDIDHCYHRPYGENNCEHGDELAGVTCTNVTENDKKIPVPSTSSGDEVSTHAQ